MDTYLRLPVSDTVIKFTDVNDAEELANLFDQARRSARRLRFTAAGRLLSVDLSDVRHYEVWDASSVVPSPGLVVNGFRGQLT